VSSAPDSVEDCSASARRPQFVLNRPDFVGASVLIAVRASASDPRANTAVWALMDYGFEAIIAPSFGDIFVNNSSKQGLVIVVLGLADRR